MTYQPLLVTLIRSRGVKRFGLPRASYLTSHLCFTVGQSVGAGSRT